MHAKTNQEMQMAEETIDAKKILFDNFLFPKFSFFI